MDKRKSMKLKMLLACVMVLICAVVAVNVLAADRSKDAKMPAATKWQYLAMTHDLALDAASRDLGRRITQIGQDGWELVSVENFSESGTTTKTVFYFKRRL